jgi:hypothetical protein
MLGVTPADESLPGTDYRVPVHSCTTWRRPPDVIREMGLASEWRHNRAGVLRAGAVTALALGVAYLLARRRRPR